MAYRYSRNKQGDRIEYRSALTKDGERVWRKTGLTNDQIKPQHERTDSQPRSMADFAKNKESITGDLGNYMLEAAGNAPQSVVNLVADTTNAFLNPLDTAKGVKDLALGAASKLGIGDHDESTVDAFGEHYSDRYGSLDAVAETFKKDPAGFLSDISVAGSLPKLGAVGKIARSLDPINAITNAPLAASQRVSEKLAPWVMKGVIKPSPKSTFSDYNKSIRYALDNEVKPTEKSIMGLNDRKSSIGNQVDDIVSEYDGTGRGVTAEDLVKPLDSLQSDIGAYTNLDSVGAHRSIDGIRDKFLRSNGFSEFENIDVLEPSQIQKFKKNANSESYANAVKNKEVPLAAQDAQKAITRAAKEHIESLDPRIKKLNDEYGTLSDLTPQVEKATKSREGSRILSMHPLLGGGIGSMIGGETGAAIGTGLGFLDSPYPKATIAIGMNKYSKSDILNRFRKNSHIGVLSRELGRTLQEDQ